MNQGQKTNTVMLSLAVAFGVFLVLGLVAIPAIDQAHASNSISGGGAGIGGGNTGGGVIVIHSGTVGDGNTGGGG